MPAPARIRLGGWTPFGVTRTEHTQYMSDLAANLYNQNCAVTFRYEDNPYHDTARGNWLGDAVDSGADIAISVDGDIWAPLGAHPTHHIYRSALTVMFAAALDRERAAAYMAVDEHDALSGVFKLDELAMLGLAVADGETIGTKRSGVPLDAADWLSPIERVDEVCPGFCIYNLRWYRDRRAMIQAQSEHCRKVRNAGGIILSAFCHTYRWPWSKPATYGVEPTWGTR